MLAPLDTLDGLKARLRESLATLPSAPGARFLSLVLELPEVPAIVPELDGPQFFLLHHHRDELRAGYGIAAEWHASGPGRLVRLREEARALSAAWQQLDPDETGFTGFTLLGFAARPGEGDTAADDAHAWPNAVLWLPEAALCARRGQAAVVLSARRETPVPTLLARWSALLDRLVPELGRPAPDPLRPSRLTRGPSLPETVGWQRLVSNALERIAARELDKVVVARRLRIEGSRRFDVPRLLAALTFFFPSCEIVSIRRNGSSFVAATPERLLAVRGNRVEVDALAGTASRAAQTHRDGALGRALLGCSKNLHEHRLVVAAIREALGECAAEIETSGEPEIMRLNNAQHLWTRISARLDGGADVFTLAGLLHPTPATNGQPRREASDWLTRSDPFDRGWYTGAAGIVEPDLSGELWVLLRCAQVCGNTADLYAGAGIVDGSDPALEWRETEHKLSAMLTALQFA